MNIELHKKSQPWKGKASTKKSTAHEKKEIILQWLRLDQMKQYQKWNS